MYLRNLDLHNDLDPESIIETRLENTGLTYTNQQGTLRADVSIEFLIDFNMASSRVRTLRLGNPRLKRYKTIPGLLVGIGVLRNLEKRKWERRLWWAAILLYFTLMIAGVLANIFWTERFVI